MDVRKIISYAREFFCFIEQMLLGDLSSMVFFSLAMSLTFALVRVIRNFLYGSSSYFPSDYSSVVDEPILEVCNADESEPVPVSVPEPVYTKMVVCKHCLGSKPKNGTCPYCGIG